LGAAEVALGRLYRDVAEEKLDLLQLAASGTTEASATPPEIVRREFAHANFGRELLDDVPDELLRHSFAPNPASATHAAEEAATGNSGRFHPVAQETAHPIGDADGPNVTSLPTQVHDSPMPFTLLEVIDFQSSKFVTPKSAGQKDSK
jgi:hypothetical protein